MQQEIAHFAPDCIYHLADVVFARAFQHAGPRQNARMMFAEWCRQFAAESHQPVRVRTRHARIDLCDARDVARAYRLLALRGQSGVAYNVGSGVMRTSGEVLEKGDRHRASGVSFAFCAYMLGASPLFEGC